MEINIRRILLDDANILAQISRQTFYDTFTGTCTERICKIFEQYYKIPQAKGVKQFDDYYYFLLKWMVSRLVISVLWKTTVIGHWQNSGRR
jgi:hypothetical protein